MEVAGGLAQGSIEVGTGGYGPIYHIVVWYSVRELLVVRMIMTMGLAIAIRLDMVAEGRLERSPGVPGVVLTPRSNCC